MKLQVSSVGAPCFERALQLSRALDLPLNSEAQADLLLVVDESGVYLQPQGRRAAGPINVDFSSAQMRHRRRGGQNELLGKAVGVGKKTRLRLIDATAGLGGDSFVLADLGCDVVCLERSPLIHALLVDGVERGLVAADAWVRQVCSRLRVCLADAVQDLSNLDVSADVIYLDPMFSNRSRAARARKPMWLLQQLVGEDLDTAQLLQAALAKAIHRVVVKRPLKAAPIDGPAPGHAIRGKAVRFDVYSKRKLEDS